jgi:hypothetical protein
MTSPQTLETRRALALEILGRLAEQQMFEGLITMGNVYSARSAAERFLESAPTAAVDEALAQLMEQDTKAAAAVRREHEEQERAAARDRARHEPDPQAALDAERAAEAQRAAEYRSSMPGQLEELIRIMGEVRDALTTRRA